MFKSQLTLLLGGSSLALLISSLVQRTPGQAQHHPSDDPILSQAVQPNLASDDWSKFPEIHQQFMQGCVDEPTIPTSQQAIRQRYCECAFNAYKTRYTPQLFSLINSYAVQIGEGGPTLVNLMMKPELDQCAVQTGYTRS